VDGRLIGRTTQPLLDGRLLNEVIVFAPHHHRRPLFLPDLCRKQICQGSCIAVQTIEPNDHVGQRKRERVGIRCNHAASLFEFLAIVAIAGVSKRAQPLVCAPGESSSVF
jgi:hypothetical protein